ncbi:hypothetical protein QQ045_027539 [Rhodiola kirilowii]
MKIVGVAEQRLKGLGMYEVKSRLDRALRNSEMKGLRNIKVIKGGLNKIKGKVRTEEVVEQENKLMGELDEWLCREEYLWRQRSRVDWLKECDQNMKYFHARVTHIRSHNKIEKLIQGVTAITDNEGMLKVVEDHFMGIFQHLEDEELT